VVMDHVLSALCTFDLHVVHQTPDFCSRVLVEAYQGCYVPGSHAFLGSFYARKPRKADLTLREDEAGTRSLERGRRERQVNTILRDKSKDS
jgi:hypothetical protein